MAKFISLNFVPVKIETTNTDLMKRYSVSWTPTVLVLDAEGREHYRGVGFFSPEDLIPTLMTAKGRWALDTDQYAEARALFEEVISCHPDRDTTAEALFFLGVSKFKMSHDPKLLRETYDELTAKFPTSSWTKQAVHYRLISN
ncbi:MAG: hypothetical protein WBQ36_03925 [Desulfobaccales bacterium]